MSDSDLTAAIEAAATRLCRVVTDVDGRWCGEHDYDVSGQLTSCWAGRDTADRAVRAAAPIIEAAVREQVAEAIEAHRRDRVRTSISPSRQTPWERATSAALTEAQGIARGQS